MRRILAIGAAPALLLALSACSGADAGADSSDAPTTSAGATSAPASPDAGDDPAGPCDLADAAAVEAALGGAIGEGTSGNRSVNDNGLKYTAEACTWETESGVELDLRTVAADELPGECPELSSVVYEITEVPDLGDAAWFEWDDLQGEGAIRACTATGIAEARVESGTTPLEQATVRATVLALVTPAVDALS